MGVAGVAAAEGVVEESREVRSLRSFTCEEEMVFECEECEDGGHVRSEVGE